MYIFHNFLSSFIIKILKIFFILLILLSVKNALADDPFWIRKPSPTFSNLKKVFFINSNTGWIAGDSGFIARTTNSGTNWTVQNTSTVNDIQAFYFVNERIGWALAWEVFPDSNTYLGTQIIKTTNGGVNWSHYMYSDTSYFMKTIFFLDSLRGYMGGAPISIVYTTNAGSTWTKTDTDTSLIIGFPVENIEFSNALTGYACGGFRDVAGSMWRTTNGGLNWLATIVGPEPLNDLYVVSTSNAIATGGDFEYGSSVVKTFDSGLHWSYDTLGTFGVATGIEYRTPSEAWITLGIAQKYAYSLDSGNTWTSIYSPDSLPVFGIDFIDSVNGWSVGYNGAIYKYNANKVNIFNTGQIIDPDNFILYQNFPNPFNPETVIRYFLNKTDIVTLKIYDALGKEILTLVNSKQYAGSHSISFSGVNLPSGIYFYELTSGNYSEVKKMLLLK